MPRRRKAPKRKPYVPQHLRGAQTPEQIEARNAALQVALFGPVRCLHDPWPEEIQHARKLMGLKPLKNPPKRPRGRRAGYCAVRDEWRT